MLSILYAIMLQDRHIFIKSTKRRISFYFRWGFFF